MCRWTCSYYICGHRNYTLNMNGYCQRYRETRRRFCAAHNHVYYNICHEGEICPGCHKAAMGTTTATAASADSYAAYKLKYMSSGGIKKPKQQSSSRSARQPQSQSKGKGMASRPRLGGSPLRQQC